MSKYGMAAAKQKDATGAKPAYLSLIYDVIEAPADKRAELQALPWNSLVLLAESGINVRKHGGPPDVIRKNVKGGERVSEGRVWFRQGGNEDGSVNGRALLYQQG